MNIIDLHQDFLSHLRFREQFGQAEQTSIAQLRAAGVTLVHVTAFPLPSDGNHCDQKVDDLITEELMMYQALAASEDIQIVKSITDRASDELQMLLHIEGLNAFAGSASDWRQLGTWVSLGVRSIGTHWNVDNQLGGGTLNTTDGLTSLGAEVVAYIEENHVLLDLAHMGRQTFIDAASIATKPLYVSHGNADVVCPNVRNYTDQQLHMIANSGGVIGVFFANTFVVGSSQQGTIDDVVSHITYIKHLIGIDHVALGSDFGGIVSGAVTNLASVSDLPNLQQALISHGYTHTEIEKIFHQNAERIIAAHLS